VAVVHVLYIYSVILCNTYVSNCYTEMTASVSTTLNAKKSTKDVSGMLSLHARLKHEAEKIRKWKIQTETELKQKVFYNTST